MWRSVLAVILTASLVLTQSAGLAEDSTERMNSISSTHPVKYQQFTYFYELRRGTTEMASISFLELQYVTSPQSPIAGIAPLNLQLKDSDGIEVENFKYPETSTRKFAFQPQSIPVVTFYDQSIHFNLQAAKTAALGPHTLTGKLTFQLITDAGINPPEQINFQFPVTVVEKGAKIQRTEWSRTQNTRRERIALIVFAPVLLVAWIAACIPGSILGYCKGS